MPRIKVILNKTNTLKLNKFFKWAQKNWPEINNEELSQFVTEQIKSEIKKLGKDCSEKMIVESWISYLQLITNPIDINELKYKISNVIKHDVREELVRIYTSKTFDNNVDIYFNEVLKEYIRHPQAESEELQFNQENKEIFIKNNLKLAVEVAKKYKNKGLPFEDLIQAGNEGLMIAFDKFKPDKANLRNAIIEDIENNDNDSFTYDEAERIIKNKFTYDKLLDKTLKKIPENGFNTKEQFIEWCHKNIASAVFASVAFKWIRSNIILELTRNGSVIRFPKATKSKNNDDNDDILTEFDEEENKRSNTIIRLDSINPYTDDNYSDGDLAVIANEEFVVEDQALENIERQQTFKSIVETLLSCLTNQERNIIRKKHGIGYPYSMTINEIAEDENISVNNVKRILRDSIFKLQENLTGPQKDMLAEIL